MSGRIAIEESRHYETVMRLRGRHLLRGLIAAAIAFGCSRENGSEPLTEATIAEPVLPAPSIASPASSPPAWLEALPEVAPTAHKGDRVWATTPVLPRAEMAEVGVFQVEEVYEGRYSLIDGLGQRIDRVPAAVVHRLGEPKGLKGGDVVLIYTKTTPAVLGRMVEGTPGGEINVRYDFGGATRTTTVDHAEPPREGLGPLSFVSFPKSGGRSRGLVVARSGDSVWVRTGSGHVEIHPEKSLEPLPLVREPLEPGVRVKAFRWATGYRPGVVTEAIEPGLRYRVRLDGQTASSDYFFTSLLRHR